MATWGELRAELAARVPGRGNDLLTTWLQRSYREILDHRDWRGLHADARLQTFAPYEVGTVALTSGSSSLTGTGTTFTAGMTGRKFRAVGRDEWYTFTYVSATSATLDRPYEGDTNAASTYLIYQDRYTLPAQVKTVEWMEGLNPENLNRLRANVFCMDIPTCWANGNDSDEATPPVLHSVELWPAPNLSMGIPYSYLTAVFEFDGLNTSDSPLPWVSQDAIVSGALYRAGVQDDSDFNKFLSNMNRVENNSTPPQQMQMADRFTAHRLRRW